MRPLSRTVSHSTHPVTQYALHRPCTEEFACLRTTLCADHVVGLRSAWGLYALTRCLFLDFFYMVGGGGSRYSTTSVYTELRHGTRDDDDGSRLLTIENHLGVAVRVLLEGVPPTGRGRGARRKSR